MEFYLVAFCGVGELRQPEFFSLRLGAGFQAANEQSEVSGSWMFVVVRRWREDRDWVALAQVMRSSRCAEGGRGAVPGERAGCRSQFRSGR